MRVPLAAQLALALPLLACANGDTNPSTADTGAPAADSIADTSLADASFDVPPTDTNTGDASFLDGDLPDGTCAAVKVDTKRTTPNVFFVIDQSGSMTMAFTGSASRWQAIEDSLIGTPDGVVTKLQHDVRFGAEMYMDDPDIAGCPDTDQTPAIIDDFVGIGNLYSRNSPGGNTPTGEAIDRVLKSLDTDLPSHATDPNVFVLATDGEPATCADGTDVPGGRALVVDRVTAAYGMGIKTYVISVGVGIALTHLQQVANAGVGVPAGWPDAPYWIATDLTGFEAAIKTIVGGAISCTIELVGKIDPTRACEGTVTLDGADLACGTDWKVVDENHIELLGAACDKLKSASATLEAAFPCDVLR